jgi:hypothetical protein
MTCTCPSYWQPDEACPQHARRYETTLADDELHDQDTQQGVWVNEGDD